MQSMPCLNQVRQATSSIVVLLLIVSRVEAAQITATWTGAGGDANYNTATNWDIGQVPLNNATDEFVVVIPTNFTVNFNVPGAGHEVFQLSLANNATFNVNPGRDLTVIDQAAIAGIISTDNGTYVGNSLAATLSGNAVRVLAQGGGSLSVGGTSFTNTALTGGDVVVAQGPGSLANLSTVLTMNSDADFGGAPTRRILASDGGVVDLSALTTVVGGRGGDSLQFQVVNGGDIRLDMLDTISGERNVRFTSDGTTIALPNLQTIQSAVLFELATGQSLSLPQLQSIDGAGSGMTTLLESPADGLIAAPNLTTFNRATLSVDSNRSLQTGILADIDGSRLLVRGGKTFEHVSSTSYYSDNYFGGGDFFLADGVGSVLDLSTLTSISFDQDFGGAPVYTIAARNGGTVDLAELTSVVGARGGDSLRLEATSGGELRLGKLTTIGGNRNVRFTSDGTEISLPMLQTIQAGVLFELAAGQILNLPQLTTINGEGSGFSTVLESSVDGAINAPLLTTMNRARLSVDSNRSVTTGVLADIDGSQFHVKGGKSFGDVSATSYSSDAYFGEGDFFLADGVGSVLDLTSLTSLNFDQDFGGAPVYTIAARDGGIVDLSEVTEVVGARGGDSLRFEATNAGELRLGKLTTISGNRNVRFTSDGSEIALPMLETIQSAVIFELAPGQIVQLPKLETLDGAGSSLTAVLEAPDNGALVAPLLSTVRRTEINLAEFQTLSLGTLTDISGSRIHVTDGRQFSAAATSYDSLDYFGAGDVFSAEGTGSSVSLSSISSINFDQDFGGTPVYTIAAREGGIVDLSGVSVVVGARGGDFLEFRADTAGRIDLSSLMTVSQNTRFVATSGGQLQFGQLNNFEASITATDVGSELNFQGGVLMGSTTTLSIQNGAEIRIQRGYHFEQTLEANVNLNAATVRFDGMGGQQMEVGGTDAGVGGFTSSNFGMGQLAIGTTTQRTSVELMDVIDNGNRGAGGESEALYLFGLGGPAGLRILNNSALVLNGINVYAWDPVAGAQVHLNSLFGPGELRIPYDDGFLQLAPLDFQWDNNAGGDFNLGGNWSDGLVPLGSDSAIWNLGSVNGYAVQFGTNVATDSAIIKSDRVTYDLGGFQYALAALNATTGLVVGQDVSDNAWLTVSNGTVLTKDVRVAAAAGSQGILEVGPTGALIVENDIVLGSGTGTLRVAPGGQSLVSGDVIISGDGRLEGAGLSANLVDNQMGTIAPGLSAGIMAIESDVLQSTNATLEIEIGGDDNSDPLSPQFDQLFVTGSAQLAGTLSVSLLEVAGQPYAPGNEIYEVISTSSGLTVDFSTIQVPQLADGTWLARQIENSFFLQVTVDLADFDADLDVDGRDFLAWQRGYGITVGATLADGDSDGDGDVDVVDLANWQAQYGFEILSLSGPLNTIAVPEPSMTVLCLCAFLALDFVRRHKDRRWIK